MLLSKKIAYGGITTALILSVISLSYVMPTADLALFTLSSLFVAILIIETGAGTGLMAYAASSILITAFYGIYYSIPFIILFGIYPIIKGLLEQHFKRLIAYIFKSVYFACVSVIAAFLFYDQSAAILAKWNQFLPGNGSLKIQTIWTIIFIIIIILLIYDFALSLLIEFFQNRIKGKYKIK